MIPSQLGGGVFSGEYLFVYCEVQRALVGGRGVWLSSKVSNRRSRFKRLSIRVEKCMKQGRILVSWYRQQP